MNIDISKLNLVELQALGYQCIASFEKAQANLTMVNQEIARRKVEVPSENKGLLVEVENLVNTQKPDGR